MLKDNVHAEVIIIMFSSSE